MFLCVPRPPIFQTSLALFGSLYSNTSSLPQCKLVEELCLYTKLFFFVTAQQSPCNQFPRSLLVAASVPSLWSYITEGKAHRLINTDLLFGQSNSLSIKTLHSPCDLYP
jgi:hypothetical protein